MHRVDRPFMAMSHLKDVDGDGYTDLDAHFRTDETGIACGDESVTLIGRMTDGIGLQGSDSIRTVGCR